MEDSEVIRERSGKDSLVGSLSTSLFGDQRRQQADSSGGQIL